MTGFVKTEAPLVGRKYLPFLIKAHQHKLVKLLLNEYSDKLRELARGLGSALHIVLPQVFRENIVSFKRVFSENEIDGVVLYARKANKANCFIKTCADSHIGVDVSSKEELAGALACGVVGEKVSISGPEKSTPLLCLGIRHHCLIAVDSLGELDRILSLSAELRIMSRILLRLRPEIQSDSRFGSTAEECRSAISLCAKRKSLTHLEGFSFHLTGYSLPDRAKVANTLIDMCLEAQGAGLESCRYVNIGGGFPVQYVAPERWLEFERINSPLYYHANKKFYSFYPYGVVTHGAGALSEILQYPVGLGVSLAERLRQCRIGILIEPGRALLDQAGVTLFRVQGVKSGYGENGYALVTVEGSSFSLSERWFNSEYLPDPILLGEPQSSTGRFLACVGGSTCLDDDMLTWRKISFSRAVGKGDYIVYLNTAGYQMDSNESCFHNIPLPKKAVIEHFNDVRGPIWHLDDVLL